MIADCLVIVNLKNETLMTYESGFSAESAAHALAAKCTMLEDEHLMLHKSYMDKDGAEVFVEIMTPWVDAYLIAVEKGEPAPLKAVIEIWHEKVPMFGLNGIPVSLDPAKFTHCADMLVPAYDGLTETSLNICFGASQNLYHAWNVSKSCRSSSVGDVFVARTSAGRQAFVIASFGFDFVNFETTKETVDLSADASPLSL